MKITCDKCGGTGLTLPLCDSECPKCGGSGQVEKVFETAKPKELDLPDTEDGELIRRLDNMDGLNDWETNFCSSMIEWVQRGRPLTYKQRDRVKKILKGER